MKFGNFDIDKAEGAILAHSIQTPNRRMRKGIVIGADDIAALKSAGITSVTAALLEHGDVIPVSLLEQLIEARATRRAVAYVV
ncbi:MAG: molybdopterin biosynthesis protein, partial [Rhodobacteraceae bacterium]|nr:molybdopterin biosynthesis protein [Paracoccaceae bacterium]